MSKEENNEPQDSKKSAEDAKSEARRKFEEKYGLKKGEAKPVKPKVETERPEKKAAPERRESDDRPASDKPKTDKGGFFSKERNAGEERPERTERPERPERPRWQDREERPARPEGRRDADRDSRGGDRREGGRPERRDSGSFDRGRDSKPWERSGNRDDRGSNDRKPWEKSEGRDDRGSNDRKPWEKSEGRDDRGNDRKPWESRSKEGGDAERKRPFDRDSRDDRRECPSGGERSEGDRYSPRGRDERSGERPSAFGRKDKRESPISRKDAGKPRRPRTESDTPKVKKPAPVRLQPESTDGQIRLNKFVADAGVCSRREADKLIEKGDITVNGEVVTTLGTKVDPTAEVKYKGKRLNREKLMYVLLNKPKDYITTTDDPQERKTVMDLVKGACDERIFPVGRLDRNTTGLLLLTNDGDLADKLTHPSYEARKIYQVEIDKGITPADFDKIIEGLELEDGKAPVDELAILSPDRMTLGIELHIGRNRIVRRIFEHLGYEVVKLDRVMYAGLTKKDLPRGKWKMLEPGELTVLKHLK